MNGYINKSIGCVSVLFSFSAVVLSIIALCSLSDHTFVTDSALVSIVGIIVASRIGIVAILIAWQVFNYFSYKSGMNGKYLKVCVKNILGFYGRLNMIISTD